MVNPLARWLAEGKLDAQWVLPALRHLAAGSARKESLPELLEELADETDPALERLALHLRNTLHREVLHLRETAAHPGLSTKDQELLGDFPLLPSAEWAANFYPAAIENALALIKDLHFLEGRADRIPPLEAVLSREWDKLIQPGSSISQWLASHASALLPQLHAFVKSDSDSDARLREMLLAELNNHNLQFQKAREDLWRPRLGTGCSPEVWQDDESLLRELTARFNQAANREDKRSILDWLCYWTSPNVIPFLQEVARETWAKDRAALIFAWRFDAPSLINWDHWRSRLSRWYEDWQKEEEQWRQHQRPLDLLLIWHSVLPEPNPELQELLINRCLSQSRPIEPRDLVQRWGQYLPVTAKNAILIGGMAADGPPPMPLERPAFVPITEEKKPLQPVKPVAEAKPVKAKTVSIWESHLQPFFVENWYIVAGIGMVLAGSSLLAYYTWDKHWLLRYTIMPALLACFTWMLAGVGDWIEKKDLQFKGTGAIMRGAAIGLLPINFMALALLAGDTQVVRKGLAGSIMVLIYLCGFGWGLKRWCSAVEPSLGKVLGGALLLLNGLVGLGALAQALVQMSQHNMWICIGAGFYAGFFALAGTVYWFTQNVITKEMAIEKRVPWFVGATLVITYLQVFAWIHGFLRHLPQAHTYALLIIAAGWLVLLVERRALELRGNPEAMGGESFLGFALILLGVLMGYQEPHIRILSFLAAGVVWMPQALARRHALHYWIALTWWILGGAAVGLLPQYPASWWPLLGVSMALGLEAGGWFSRFWGAEALARTCSGMQTVLLFLTTLITPLVQWHYRSEPLATAGWLVVVAALFGRRAWQEQKLAWLHATMVTLALALPYVGFVDMAARTSHGNTLIFGLSLLSFAWLAATWYKPVPLILEARSSVLWFYGVLAVAAMLLRVAMGDAAPNPQWYHHIQDYLGPVLMMVSLIFTTYYSRSLIPASMAVLIMVILFPELKSNLQRMYPDRTWGTGLGSAFGGLALILMCFRLRVWAPIQKLTEGDRFLGRDPFPCRRCDHTLFTWPIVAGVLFFAVKVDTWNMVRNLSWSGIPFQTAVAMAITGITWTFLAIYHRTHPQANTAVHLGWISVLIGVLLGYGRRADSPYWVWPFLAMGLLLQALYWLYRYGLEAKFPWIDKLLAQPTRQVLLAGSLLLSMACLLCLLYGAAMDRLVWLWGFLVCQLAWQTLSTRRKEYGTILFFMVIVPLLAWTAPGPDFLLERISVSQSLTPILWLIAVVQMIMLGLEQQPSWKNRLDPLLAPIFTAVTIMVLLLGMAGIVDGATGQALSSFQQLFLLMLLGLTARAQVSGGILLIGMLFAYVAIHHESLMRSGHIETLFVPWRLSVLGLVMVLLTQVGCLAHRLKPRWLTGSYPLPLFNAPSCTWIYRPATWIAGLAAAYHTLDSTNRGNAAQLLAPYLGALTAFLIAWFWARGHYYVWGGLLLILGNVHFVRLFGGEWLQAHGLSDLHLLCLGLGMSLLQASLLRWRYPSERILVPTNQASLALAGLVLSLLCVNYFTDPNLALMTPWRFVVSGALAWMAGRYFHRAARQPGPGEENYGDLCEALYHFGMVLTLWCAMLLVPWLRTPLLTLFALGVPVGYFYARAEWGFRSGAAEARRYRNSAAALGFVVLGMYVFKGVFHLLLFPGTPIDHHYYHFNAPLVMVLALVLLRLHGLGGSSWLAFYGGLALMGGSYFLITLPPGFSPFEAATTSAWCALGWGHFWITASHARSPLRTLVQVVAKLDEAAWTSSRHAWGLCLLGATQGLVLLGLSDYQVNPYQAAPLLAGAATIWIHQGIIRKSTAYLLTAVAQLVLALHMDFLVASYLPKDLVIWVILAIWLAMLFIHQRRTLWMPLELLNRAVPFLVVLTFAHVFYQQPDSNTGLWGMGLGALLTAWHPCRLAGGATERVCAMALYWVPVWLVYFSQVDYAAVQAGCLPVWPMLSALMAFFLLGVFARVFPERWAPRWRSWPRSGYRLFDEILAWLEARGRQVYEVTLWATLALVAFTQSIHYDTAFLSAEIAILTTLEAALAVAWYYQGKSRESTLAYYLAEVSALALFVSLRRHLIFTAGGWHYEYDVWASLTLSFLLSGFKQTFDFQPRAMRAPVLTSICLLPVVALVWVSVHGLGANLALLVVGLHSLMFAYLGKDERESPFNIAALTGFVAFLLMFFWSKLHWQTAQAYVIPVGIGVLVLLQMFHQRIPPETRNGIRLATLLAMFGSAGYYALIDPRYPLVFNLTLIAICLAAMGLGTMPFRKS